MSEVGVRSESIHLEFRLRPDERMFYALRHGRLYRILGPLGVAFLLIVALGMASDWIWLLVPLGIAFAFAFVWTPFTAKFRATAVAIDVTGDGLTFAAGGVTDQMSWGAVRTVRRVGQAMTIEFEPAGTVAIPVRAFRDGEVVAFEALASMGRNRASGPTQPDAEPILIRARSDLRFRDAVAVLAFRPLTLAPLATGVILIAAGVSELLAPPSDPFKSTTMSLIVVGVVFLTLPLWGAAMRVYLGGGPSAMTAPYDVEIGTSGYRARLRNADSWTTWDSFQSVRHVGTTYAFRVRGSNGEVLMSARGFTASDLRNFRDVLKASGLKGA